MRHLLERYLAPLGNDEGSKGVTPKNPFPTHLVIGLLVNVVFYLA